MVSLHGTGVTSVTAWHLLSQVSLSLHGPRGVATVSVLLHTSLGCHTVSPWLHSPTRVTRSCCAALRCCTAPLLLPGVSHGVTVTAQCTGCHCHCGAAGCHAVSLQLPWIVTQSHHQSLVLGLSHNAMSLRGPQGVTHCHCHCRPTVYHPLSPSLHGPRGVTHCHRHCTAWGATHRHNARSSPVALPAPTCHCAPSPCHRP